MFFWAYIVNRIMPVSTNIMPIFWFIFSVSLKNILARIMATTGKVALIGATIAVYSEFTPIP